MFNKEDNSFNDVRAKSVLQWLDSMVDHNDIEVRGGVKVTKDYIDSLKQQIKNLEDKNNLKDKYLKKLKKN